MSLAVERFGGPDADLPVRGSSSIVIRPGAYRPQHSAISVFMDIGQGAGLATAGGARPLLPPIVAGVLAAADAGTDFTGTDWSWMESPIWIGALVLAFASGWIFDRSRPNDRAESPEAKPAYPVLCAAMGALVFAASLAAGNETSWPGIAAGALLGFLGYLAIARLFMRANQRLATGGDSGALLGIGRDLSAIAVCVAVVFLGALGFVVVVAALLLLLGARRGAAGKYEGLRVLR